jgi:hypothetical protein
MVAASNAAHDELFRTARDILEDFDGRRMPPAWVFAALVAPEDRPLWFRNTIEMMFGRKGHGVGEGEGGVGGREEAKGAGVARPKPLAASSFIKVRGKGVWGVCFYYVVGLGKGGVMDTMIGSTGKTDRSTEPRPPIRNDNDKMPTPRPPK